MSTDHNRIKVADLEKNEQNKTLITNENGELEFVDLDNIKTDSYNSLDYSIEGKALDARQGKILKDLIDNINELLVSDNLSLNSLQKLTDAMEAVQSSLSTIVVNNLTTGGADKALSAEMGKVLQSNKVDKVAGERLINTAEIIKLSGLTNITTTLKTIPSTALPNQNVAGFVTYINSLNPVLNVGANEIVKYTTSDTGRTFELNLRGRSFGTGQPAITTADVIEVTDFLNKDIRLSNYPNTRNDGKSPTNRVLGTDANGNLKMYTITTSPAPYLTEITPTSYLPNTTGNIILKGAFFTPTMTVSITGQTVNYITFISDNEIRVNITTGTSEGYFAITLNNGLNAIFPNALSIILGTVNIPNDADWTNKTTVDTSSAGEVKLVAKDVIGSANLNPTFWSFNTGVGKRFSWKWQESMFENNPVNGGTEHGISLYRLDDTLVYRLSTYGISKSVNSFRLKYSDYISSITNNNFEGVTYEVGMARTYVFERSATGLLTLKRDGIVVWTPPFQETLDLKIGIVVGELDVINIKCINLA